jgi:hypothetical protein
LHKKPLALKKPTFYAFCPERTSTKIKCTFFCLTSRYHCAKMLKLIFVFTCLLLAVPCQAKIIIVNWDGSGDYLTIQEAINDSNNGDTVIVANGMYTGHGNRDIDFLGKAITLCSENGPKSCIIDCNGTEIDPHRGFYFHNGEDSNSVLDGFTIINGYGPNNGDLFSHGGAIFCIDSSPTINHCTFTGNWAEFGGGIDCRQSSACIINSTFTGNFANSWGGGLHFWEGNPIVSHCIISNNTSVQEGGGINYGGNQNPTISYCTISGNSAFGRGLGGGGINLSFGTSTTAARISYCTISRNVTDYSGGGIRLEGPITHSSLANVIINNCIITENSKSFRGGGIAFWGGNCVVDNCTISANTGLSMGTGIYCNASNVRVANSVIWSPIYGYEVVLDFTVVGAPGETVCEISYSNVDGGQTDVLYMDPYDCTLNWGPGNIDADPCFADVNNDDYHLKSQAGRWDPNSESWVLDDVTSPGIDAGDPMSPIGPEPFPNGGRINMGAYGGTVEASKSYFGDPVCEIVVAGDINGDCKVNFLDFRLMALHWLQDNNL